MIQGSEAWVQARCGRVTASCFSDVLAKGEGKMRAKYLRRVLCERLTGKPMESYSNGHMERGTEQEPYARFAYEAETGNFVQEVGFIEHPELMCGASPDGLVNDDGGVEIKSVLATVQLETIERGGFPPEHKAQIQGNLWITGRRYWHFVSYSPDMPAHLRLYIFRVERDEPYIATLETEVRTFLVQVERKYQQLMNLGRPLTELLIASIDANALGTQA